jgi:peroxiredoxin
MKDSLLTEDPILRELVMLKGLYDGFYSNKFNKKAIIDMIDTFFTFSQNDYHIAISKKIYEKITRLREGHEPPDFRLYDRDSNLVCLDSLKGPYIYLGFCNSMNYSCLRDYKVLNNLYKKHKDHFKIIIISTEENPETLEHYVEQKNIPWTMLHYGNDPEVLKRYNVKVMPSYFFINPDGKLSISPAPGPSEKIEWEIFKLMRKRGDLR